jgi:hypothetical protein
LTTTLPHLLTDAISTSATMVASATAVYTVTLTTIALTAVFARTPERRQAARETLATLIRRRSS